MTFPELTSGYKVGTAGTDEIGRGDTFQYLHGSEVAFWPHADKIFKGALRAVPDVPGSEIWLESTANGVGGSFHEAWQGALKGQNDFLPVFLPWTLADEYRADVPEGFELSDEEKEYRAIFGTTLEQMVWRRKQMAILKGGGFKQEFPVTAEEAFQANTENLLIDPLSVARAMREDLPVDDESALVIGVDAADGGADKTAIIRRRGRKAYGLELFQHMKSMEIAGKIVQIIDNEDPQRIFVDKGLTGSAIVDRLKEMGKGKKVSGINFSSNPLNGDKYKNMRAEMWGKMGDWLEDAPCAIPDSDLLQQDLCAVRFKYTSLGQVQLEAKSEMRSRGLTSTDAGDALALTFAYPISAPRRHRRDRYSQPKRHHGVTWMGV
jgi:hypothetical protein